MRYVLTLLILLAGLGGCKHQSAENEKAVPAQKTQMLPTSTGGEYNVIIVADQIQNNQPLKTALDSIFKTYYPALPQLESWFIPTYVDIANFGSLSQKNMKVFFLSVAKDQTALYLEKEAPQLVKPAQLSKSNNIWSSPQLVMHLNASSEGELLDAVYQYKNQVIELCDQNTKQKLKQVMYGNFKATKLKKLMIQRHNFSLDLPTNYKLIYESLPGKNDSIVNLFELQGLVWYRSETKRSNNNILIYYFDYNEEMLNDPNKMFDMKNRVSKMVQSEKPGSYMDIDTMNFRYFKQTKQLVNAKAIELRGLWHWQNDWGGGPFINYIIPDKKNNRIIYIDAFIYAPGANKKSFVERLGIVLESFKL